MRLNDLRKSGRQISRLTATQSLQHAVHLVGACHLVKLRRREELSIANAVFVSAHLIRQRATRLILRKDCRDRAHLYEAGYMNDTERHRCGTNVNIGFWRPEQDIVLSRHSLLDSHIPQDPYLRTSSERMFVCDAFLMAYIPVHQNQIERVGLMSISRKACG